MADLTPIPPSRPGEKEPPGGDSSPSAPPPATTATRIRFCRTCGAAWDPTWTECPTCAPTPGAADDASSAPPATTYEQDVRWVKSSVRLYFALLAVCLGGAVVGMNTETGESRLGLEITLSVLISLVTVAWCVFAPAGVLPLMRSTGPLRWYAVAAAASAVTYLTASSIVNALHAAIDMPAVRYLDPFDATGTDWRWAILTVCVQPAVFEELAFRGFIQTALQRVIGPIEAVVTSALMFGILHCSAPSMPHLLLMGVALGLLRLKTASLYPGMLLHFCHNFLVLLSERSGRVTPW